MRFRARKYSRLQWTSVSPFQMKDVTVKLWSCVQSMRYSNTDMLCKASRLQKSIALDTPIIQFSHGDFSRLKFSSKDNYIRFRNTASIKPKIKILKLNLQLQRPLGAIQKWRQLQGREEGVGKSCRPNIDGWGLKPNVWDQFKLVADRYGGGAGSGLLISDADVIFGRPLIEILFLVPRLKWSSSKFVSFSNTVLYTKRFCMYFCIKYGHLVISQKDVTIDNGFCMRTMLFWKKHSKTAESSNNFFPWEKIKECAKKSVKNRVHFLPVDPNRTCAPTGTPSSPASAQSPPAASETVAAATATATSGGPPFYTAPASFPPVAPIPGVGQSRKWPSIDGTRTEWWTPCRTSKKILPISGWKCRPGAERWLWRTVRRCPLWWGWERVRSAFAVPTFLPRAPSCDEIPRTGRRRERVRSRWVSVLAVDCTWAMVSWVQ